MATLGEPSAAAEASTTADHRNQVHQVLAFLVQAAGIKAKLYPYQLDGLARLLLQQSWSRTVAGHKENLQRADDYGYYGKNFGLGIMQSDATGLGKTLQTISLAEVCRFVAFLEEETILALPPSVQLAVREIQGFAMTRRIKAGQPVLVVCPLSVFVVWRQELASHTSIDLDRVMIYHGPSRDKLAKSLRGKPASGCPLYILTTPHVLVSDGGLRAPKGKRDRTKVKKFGVDIPNLLAKRAKEMTGGNRLLRQAPSRRALLERMRKSGGIFHLSNRRDPKSLDVKRSQEKVKMERRATTEALRHKSKEAVLAARRGKGGAATPKVGDDVAEAKVGDDVFFVGGSSPVWETDLKDIPVVAAPLDPAIKSHWKAKGFLFRLPLAALFIDEAPYTTTSGVWQALHALTRDPFLFRVVMTASPICNSIADLAARLALAGFSPFEWASPSYLSLIDPRPTKAPDTKEVEAGCSDMVKRLREVAMICRPKSTLGPLLPPLVPEETQVILTALEQRIYEDCLHNTAHAYKIFMAAPDLGARQSAWAAALLRLLRLRQATTHPGATLGREAVSRFCSRETAWLVWKASDRTAPEPPRPSDPGSALMRHESAKFTATADIIAANQAAGLKTLVVSQWTSMMDLFELYMFSRRHMQVLKFDGRLDLEQRAKLLDVFKTAPPSTFPAMLLQLQTGGVGLTITGTEANPVNQVVFLDNWFNPFVEDQARDRVWRQSQTRKVTSHMLRGVYPPTTADNEVVDKEAAQRTIDHAILRLQRSKRDTAHVYIGHGDDVLEFESVGGGPGADGAGVNAKEVGNLLQQVMYQERMRNEGV